MDSNYNSNRFNNYRVSKKGSPITGIISMLLIVLIIFVGLVAFNVIDDPLYLLKNNEIKEMHLTVNSLEMRKGETTHLETTNENSDVIEYISNDSNIVTVNEVTGYVKAVGYGTTDIVVRLKNHNEISDTCTISVVKPISGVSVSSIDFTTPSISLNVGSSRTLYYKITPSNAENKKITWSTSNSEIATIDKYGTVKGISEGTAIIKVKTGNGKVASCEVTVTKKPKDGSQATPTPQPTTQKYTLTFNANGGTVSLSSKTLSNGEMYGSLPIPTRSGYIFNGWYSQGNGGTQISEEDIISNNVTIYAHWNKIETSTSSKYVLTYNANGGSVNPGSKALKKGEKYGSLPTPTRSGYIFNGWYTLTSGGSKVSSNTTINANTTIYAQWTKKVTSIEVTSISFESNSVNLKVGSNYNLKSRMTIKPSNSTNKSVTWTSSNTNIATVTDGVVNGKKEGTVTIIAKTSNGKTATCKVTVTKKTSTSDPPPQSAKTVEIMNSAVKYYYNNNKTNSDIRKIKSVYEKYKCNKETNICWWPNSNITSLKGNIKVYDKNKKYLLTIDNYNLSNILIPGNNYYLENGNTTEYIYVNKNAYRMIKVQGVPNIRDLGGKSGSNGTIKYGLLYRGSNPNTNGPEAASVFKQIGINTIVDLRLSDEDRKKQDKKILNDPKIKKVVRGASAYPKELTNGDNNNRKAVRYIMESIVNGKKVYFHCAVGKDRTGTIAYMLEAILGVDSNNLLKDYSLSYFTYPDTEGKDSIHYEQYDPFVNYIGSYKGDDIETKAINWFITKSSNKTSDIDLINKFREKMITGSPVSYKLDSSGNAVKGTAVPPTSTPSKSQKIHFIKQSGAGDAILLESNGKFAMIDTGVPEKNSNDCSLVTNYLKSNKVSKLDFILITHAHNDHIGCGESILNNYNVNDIYIKEYYDNTKGLSGVKVKQYNNFINKAKEKNSTIHYVNKESDSDTYVKNLKFGNMDIKLYNTKQRMDESPWNGNNGLYNNENNNSIMALVTVNGRKTFLTGDMEDVNIMKIIVPNYVNNIDVLKLPHHGAGAKEEKESGFSICGLNKSLANKLQPSYIVATNSGKVLNSGKANQYHCFNQHFENVENRTYTKGKNALAVQDYNKSIIFDYTNGNVSVIKN